MKILHYTLGLPPFRTGGLTKYSMDLMLEQYNQGHTISLLYPGRMSIINSNTKIKRKDSFKGIRVYEIINSLPISLLNGILNINKYTANIPQEVYLQYLLEIKPDIIHLHTLMGIHKEFLEVAKQLGIKMVYTTHDYFGICPKVNMIDSKGIWCEDFSEGNKCISCNQTAFSIPLIFLMQSNIYRSLKDKKYITHFKESNKAKINSIREDLPTNETNVNAVSGNMYVKLREYYLNMFLMIDSFHFNSTVAESVYNKYLGKIIGDVIPITHRDIIDQRSLKNFSENNAPLKITYLGPMEEYKGFNLLVSALEEIKNLNIKNWHLNIYGDNKNVQNLDPEFFSVEGRYDYSELKTIFNDTDLLVIPSKWKETFGFIGLEALSFGVPILSSDYVGFKDILKKEKAGIIFNPNQQDLMDKLIYIIRNREILVELNKNILKLDSLNTLEKHANKMIQFYNVKEQ